MGTAKITYAISNQNYELVRDKVAAILALELPNQATLNAESHIDASVFTERITSIDAQEKAVVNVILSRLELSNDTAFSQKNEMSIVVEVYTQAYDTANDRGDELAAMKNHRIAGIIRTVLMSRPYARLGFDAGFIENRTISEISRTIPRNQSDAANNVMTTISMQVKCVEDMAQDEGVEVARNSTIATVIKQTTEKGIEYTYVKS